MTAISIPVPSLQIRTEAKYRRRRAAVAAVLGGTLFMGGLAVGALSDTGAPAIGSGSAEAPEPIARSTYVVQPGDTLWTIARRIQPTGDVRPLVDRLADAHGGGALQVGDRITL